MDKAKEDHCAWNSCCKSNLQTSLSVRIFRMDHLILVHYPNLTHFFSLQTWIHSPHPQLFSYFLIRRTLYSHFGVGGGIHTEKGCYLRVSKNLPLQTWCSELSGGAYWNVDWMAHGRPTKSECGLGHVFKT